MIPEQAGNCAEAHRPTPTSAQAVQHHDVIVFSDVIGADACHICRLNGAVSGESKCHFRHLIPLRALTTLQKLRPSSLMRL